MDNDETIQMSPEKVAELIKKDKERRLKQLQRVQRWTEAHPNEMKERRKIYAKTYRDKKKAENAQN